MRLSPGIVSRSPPSSILPLLRRLRAAVDAAGYTGPIEVEIFNEALWALPGDELLRLTVTRYVEYVL